jgi:hypothetical protein
MSYNYASANFNIEVVCISMDGGKSTEYKMYLQNMEQNKQHVLGQYLDFK